jgi:hypothetical protein
MNAYNSSANFATSMRSPVSRHARAMASQLHEDPTKDLHNARGLVIAILMSAACWAGVGLAFLL